MISGIKDFWKRGFGRCLFDLGRRCISLMLGGLEVRAKLDMDMEATLAFLRGSLYSVHGWVVSDGIPGYGLEVGLLELISLCMFARVAGLLVRWYVDNIATAEHW